MKSNTRKRLAHIRNSFNPKERNKLSELIKNNLLNLEEYKNAKTVLLYCSFGSEVETNNMIRKSVDNKITLLPLIIPEEKTIVACKIQDVKNDVNPGYSDILEPRKHCKEHNKNKINLVIVPGIAFGEKGERLGYGGGYYDRFLKDFTGDIVGICFENQITDKILLENHDIKMHKIVTEKRVIDCEK